MLQKILHSSVEVPLRRVEVVYIATQQIPKDDMRFREQCFGVECGGVRRVVRHTGDRSGRASGGARDSRLLGVEQAHIPALLPLLRGGERAQEGGRGRDRERDGATDVRRPGGADSVGDHAAPVVADEVDLAAEAIDQGEGVGGEGVEVVGTDDRREGVAAQPWRNDAVGLGEVLEEGGVGVMGKVEEETGAR